MREETGNLWDRHASGSWVAITTNGSVTKAGKAVMGRGVALDAAKRFPDLPLRLGDLLRTFHRMHEPGLHLPVHVFPEFQLMTYPVKHHWSDDADPALIVASAHQLMEILNDGPFWTPKQIYTVRPGCGSGRLKWADVKPLIAPILDERVIIVERAHGSR